MNNGTQRKKSKRLTRLSFKENMTEFELNENVKAPRLDLRCFHLIIENV